MNIAVFLKLLRIVNIVIMIVLWISFIQSMFQTSFLLIRDDKTSLVIIPDKQGNLARYFSGINNYTKDGKKKQVYC